MDSFFPLLTLVRGRKPYWPWSHIFQKKSGFRDCYPLELVKHLSNGCTPLVMHWGAPGRNRSCPCTALFQEWAVVPDSLGRITFLGRGATSKAGIGFLDRQHLSITDNLEIATGSNTVEILKVAIKYIAHRLDLKSVCASAYLLIG